MTIHFVGKFIGRTAEEGARQLIWTALAKSSEEASMKGAYIASMEIREPCNFVVSQKGKDFREELFVSHSSFSQYMHRVLRLSVQTDTLDILSVVDPKIKSIRDQYLH